MSVPSPCCPALGCLLFPGSKPDTPWSSFHDHDPLLCPRSSGSRLLLPLPPTVLQLPLLPSIHLRILLWFPIVCGSKSQILICHQVLHDLLLFLQAPALHPAVPLCGAHALLGSDETLLAGLSQIYYIDLAPISPMSYYLPMYLSLLQDAKVGETSSLS